MVKTSSGDRSPLAAKKALPFVAEGGSAFYFGILMLTPPCATIDI